MCGLRLEAATYLSCGADVVGNAFSESAMKMNWACMAAMQGAHEANRMLRGDTSGDGRRVDSGAPPAAARPSSVVHMPVSATVSEYFRALAEVKSLQLSKRLPAARTAPTLP